MQIRPSVLAAGVALFQLAAPTTRVTRSESVVVRSVFDGDTIDVATYGRVRLLGIDAPELGRGYDTPAPFGREARERLTQLTLHRWVRLEQEGAALDVYNRHLAYVLTEDGVCVNAALVRDGLARVSARMALWLGAVLVGTGIAGLRGALPGVEPKPYIIRFTEDRPNPLYRRVCYTFAWSEVVAFAVLNITGLVVAIATGHWYLKQIYWYAYFPIAGTIWLLGLLGQLPRVKASTKGEGHERRYFYGSVWAVCWAQPALWLMWKVVPRTTAGDTLKLVVFLAILAFVGNLARLGRLPRTRPIVPGELAVSD